MSNQNGEVQSWKYDFSTWAEKPSSVASSYNTSMSLAGWALFFFFFFLTALGNWACLKLKLSQDYKWSSKRQEELRQSPSTAGLLQSDTKPGTWESRTVWLPDPWFLSILGLQRQNNPKLWIAHSIFLASQIPSNLQIGCWGASVTMFSEAHQMMKPKHHTDFPLLQKPTREAIWQLWFVF